ncbi:MAG TPA: PAS domain-containing protein [Stellaceae bacterium]|nr:PAS domain-containing protein [Stellaceae bacterium]
MSLLHLDDHPRFRHLADYLAAKVTPGRLAGRQHLEPTELGNLLPWMMLVDVLREPGDKLNYRIRLVGTQVVAIQGSDATGKLVDEVLNTGAASAIFAGYDEIVHSSQPGYREGVVATEGRDHVFYRRVAFPLARDGETVDMLLFVFVRDSA